jgi:hypothetical protein
MAGGVVPPGIVTGDALFSREGTTMPWLRITANGTNRRGVALSVPGGGQRSAMGGAMDELIIIIIM